MGFKLARADARARDKIAARLACLSAELAAAATRFNEEAGKLFAPVASATLAYNVALEDAQELRAKLLGEWAHEVAGKGQRWLDSERGQAAMGFIEALDDVDVYEVGIPEPDAIDASGLDHAERLRAAPERCDFPRRGDEARSRGGVPVGDPAW